MMIGNLLYVNDINFESRQRAESIQLRVNSRSFAIHRFHIWKRETEDMHTCVFCLYIQSMNHTYAYLRDDRKIKFRMVSAQYFINEAPGVVWIIVMFLSAVWTLILTAPIHCRRSTAEQAMLCYASLQLCSLEDLKMQNWWHTKQ